MTIVFRSPVAGGVLPSTAPVPPIGTFRVTQRFSDLDSYWSTADPARAKQQHNAVDIGNRRCGDPILAMAPGTAYRIQDNATAFGAKSNALGVAIEHGEGVRTEYWHLASQTIINGAKVVAGQEIGKLGATGLGAVCHTHIVMRVNGVLTDPEPYIYGATYPAGAMEDDMWRKDAKLIPLTRLVLKAGTVPYADPDGSTEHSAGFAFADNDEVLSSLIVPGKAYGASRPGGIGLFWILASGVKREMAEQATVDCSAAVNAAVQPLQAKIVAARNALA